MMTTVRVASIRGRGFTATTVVAWILQTASVPTKRRIGRQHRAFVDDERPRGG